MLWSSENWTNREAENVAKRKKKLRHFYEKVVEFG